MLFPVFDRWQNLRALAQQIHLDTAGENLALLQPDETTIAMLDYRLHTPYTVLPAGDNTQQVILNWVHQHGAQARVLIKLPGHAPGEIMQLIGRVHRMVPDGNDPADALEAAGISRTVARYELPQGRRYVLLAPTPHYS